MAAVAVCSSHRAADLAGPHVLATFDNFSSSVATALLQRLIALETDHAARS
jgi:hypothetical protein